MSCSHQGRLFGLDEFFDFSFFSISFTAAPSQLSAGKVLRANYDGLLPFFFLLTLSAGATSAAAIDGQFSLI